MYPQFNLELIVRLLLIKSGKYYLEIIIGPIASAIAGDVDGYGRGG